MTPWGDLDAGRLAFQDNVTLCGGCALSGNELQSSAALLSPNSVGETLRPVVGARALTLTLSTGFGFRT